jgi:hypothetical protein
MRLLSLFSLTLLIACPDPDASSSGMKSTSSSTGSDPQATTGSQETDPSAARLNCAEGDENCITISGSLVYDGTPTGSIRMDVQKVRKGSAPSLVHTLELTSIDEFSFDAPKGYGQIIVTGFIDEAGDGPSQQDPQGRLTIDIGEETLSDLKIEIKSNNAPVQPKPPSDKPEDKSGDKGQEQGTPSDKDGAQKSPTPAEAPPADDAPPADE